MKDVERGAVLVAGADHGGSDKQEQRTVQTYSWECGKRAPSISPGGSLFLRKVKWSSGKNSVWESASLGLES